MESVKVKIIWVGRYIRKFRIRMCAKYNKYKNDKISYKIKIFLLNTFYVNLRTLKSTALWCVLEIHQAKVMPSNFVQPQR